MATITATISGAVGCRALVVDADSGIAEPWIRGATMADALERLITRPDEVQMGGWADREDAWEWEWYVGRAARRVYLGDSARSELARRLGWTVISNRGDLPPTVLWEGPPPGPLVSPLRYCGVWPARALAVFVGEARNTRAAGHELLPFGTEMPTRYGRTLGNAAFKCGWTNAGDVDPEELIGTRTIVACGNVAHKWVTRNVRRWGVLRVPHPSWLYRWGNAAPEIEPVERKLRAVILGGFEA